MSQCKECGSKLVVRGHKCQNCGATVRTRVARIILLGVFGGIVVSCILTLAQDYADRIQALFGVTRPAAATASVTPTIPDSVQAILTADKATNPEIKPDAPDPGAKAEEQTSGPAPAEHQPPVPQADLNQAAILSVGYLTPVGSLDRTLEDIIIEVMGRTAGNFSTPTFIRLHKEADGVDGSLLKLTIVYRARPAVTPAQTRADMFQAALEVYRRIFASEMLAPCSIVSLRPTLSGLTALGRQREIPVANLVLRRVVADRIEWPKMTPAKFETILRQEDNFYLHPTLK